VAGAYAYTPAMWPPLLGGLLLAVIGLYSWRRRDMPGARWLVAGSALGVLWLLGITLQTAAVGPATKLVWFKFQAAWHLPALTTSACFVLEYADPACWLSRRRIAALWLPPVLFALAVLTAPQLLWTSMQVSAEGLIRLERTVGIGLLYIYALGLLLVTTAAFLWLFIRSPLHRWPVSLMLTGLLVAYALYLLDRAYSVSPAVNLTVAAVVVLWSLQAIALFGFRILDPLPFAWQAVFRQMHAGVVVFDDRWRAVGLNPAAAAILGVVPGAARGKPWHQVIPAAQPLPELLQVGAAASSTLTDLPEMTLGRGPDARHYALALSELRDFRGLLMGHLLMLADVTEQRRAQTLALEQQRVLATQRERERMARELHDCLGQVLSYASLQAGSAAQLALGGRGEDAATQLDCLGNVVREAHADLREQILNLTSPAPLDRSLFSATKQYLDGFTRSYNVQARLTVAPGLSDETLPPETKQQLFRIVQEALSNARKHGKAHQVRVAFAARSDSMQMVIEDDGCGFDPQQVADSGGCHYGLAFMRARAEELGGNLQVISAPGSGTRVVLEIPVNSSLTRSPRTGGHDESTAGGRSPPGG
jgi:signal transduction histidine kinase